MPHPAWTSLPRRVSVWLAALGIFGGGHSGAQEAKPLPVSLWYSTGDAIHEYKWMPMDSAGTIAAGFDVLAGKANVGRILWRDANIEWIARYNRLRKDSAFVGPSVQAWIDMNEQEKTTELAWKAAKARGIQFWGIFHLFDYGAKAETGSTFGYGPFAMESEFLSRHPEYRVWDRARITYMSGIEYGNPEVRKEYVRRIEELLAGPWKPYEGFFIYSFIEHMDCRYSDEYIYSDFAVADFKKRHGVDMRTQPFDLDGYNAMRGEYITQYLREVRAVLNKHGKKLAVTLNPANMEMPQRWSAAPADMLQQGRTKFDWRTWVKEGLVDELNVWGGEGPDKKVECVQTLLKETEGTGVQVTVFSQRELPEAAQSLYAKGVRRVVATEPANEEGHAEKRPATDIDSQDAEAVLSVLTQVRNQTLEVPAEKIVALLKHPHPFVRRQAANTIGTLKLQEGVAALEAAAVKDSEPSVRAMIFDALGKVNGPNSVAALATSFRSMHLWPMRTALRNALGMMGPERFGDIVKSYDTSDGYFRTVLLQSFSRRQPAPEFYPVVKKALTEDKEEMVRFWAALALVSYRKPETVQLLQQALDDASAVVQNRAAMTLKGMMVIASPEQKKQIFEKLMARYQEFGPECERADKEWGWRTIGEAIKDGFGTEGRNALINILNGSNAELGRLTWKVLFLPNDSTWHPMTRDEMEKLYRHYPGRADREAYPPVKNP